MIYSSNSVTEFLSEELRRRVRLNPRYSLRSFAKHLRLSPGALSEILRGRRDLSLKSVPSVAKAIGLNSSETAHLMQIAQLAKAKEILAQTAEDKSRERKTVNEDMFNLIADWYHFALLNLLECEGFEWQDQWISRRLNITRIQAKMAMDLLLRLGLIVRKGRQFEGSSSEFASTSDVPSAAIRDYHRQILEKAAQALEAQTVDEREISGSGLALDVARLPALKKELSDFQDRILDKYSKGKKTEVYFLEIALFKLTHGSPK